MTCAGRIGRTALLAIALSLAPAASPAAAADDARETRWASEVVPQLVVGDAVWLATPHRARVLALHAEPAGPPAGAVIVVHGLGVHPDWGLIGELRTLLTERGFVTLSVQMPVLAADAPRDDYAALMPLAAERLDAALAWLRGQGHDRVGVVSHSMGAVMVDAWLARSAPPRVDAWVPIGLLVPFSVAPPMPVLDVIAGRDYPEVLAAAPARAARLRADGCSGAAVIPGTDHFLAGAVPRAIDRIAPFLVQALAGRCRG